MEESFKRKLTAILSADAAGYSRLMADNEEETVRTIKSYRKVMESLITKYTGRLVDSPGDNILAEFPSVVDGLRCAWDIQKEIKSRNMDLAENRRMTFRIGINLGDVIEEEGRIYGDGVNVAARLESLAEPSGICISGIVYNQVKKKLPFRFEDQGEQSVKNIEEPVQVYRVLMESETTDREAVRLKTEPDEFKLPEGPSIAVLPFDNMSGDKEQEYICDGLTENIITSLSYNPKLFVIARNSSFHFKGKSPKVQEVARELGVQYVLEGSFQKIGDRVRITAQLIDANKGHHLWAERYDRDLKDFFVLQDEIAEKIFTALTVKLTDGEWVNISAKYPISFEARLKMMKAVRLNYRHNLGDNILARQEAEQALELSPNHPNIYIALAWNYFGAVLLNSNIPPIDLLAKASKYAEMVLDIDDKNPDPHIILSMISLFGGAHDEAIDKAKVAITLNPNYDYAYYTLGNIYTYADEPERGLELIKKAIKLNPIPHALYLLGMGNAYCFLGRYNEAITVLKKNIARDPDHFSAHLALALTYSLSNQDEKAQKEIFEVLKLYPEFSLEKNALRWPLKNQDQKERFIEALRKAGLK